MTTSKNRIVLENRYCSTNIPNFDFVLSNFIFYQIVGPKTAQTVPCPFKKPLRVTECQPNTYLVLVEINEIVVSLCLIEFLKHIKCLYMTNITYTQWSHFLKKKWFISFQYYLYYVKQEKIFLNTWKCFFWWWHKEKIEFSVVDLLNILASTVLLES